MSAFTYSFNGKVRELIVPAKVSLPIPGKIKEDDKRIFDTLALWDTGASGSVITKSLAQKMGLKPQSRQKVYHAGGQSISNVYIVNIYFEPKIRVLSVRVTECDDNHRFGMIIGMDVITMGDFSISNFANKTTFSFRVPSEKKTDYVKEHNERKEPIQMPQHPGRNDWVTIINTVTWQKKRKKWKHAEEMIKNGGWVLDT